MHNVLKCMPNMYSVDRGRKIFTLKLMGLFHSLSHQNECVTCHYTNSVWLSSRLVGGLKMMLSTVIRGLSWLHDVLK